MMKKNKIVNQFSRLKKKPKRGCFSLFALLFSFTFSAQTTLSTAENYVYTKSCLDADCVKKAETVQYFDGLGRPIQTVAINATPQGKDIVIPVEYNPLGKKVKNYLPIPQQTAGGTFYQTPFNNVSNTYGNEKIYSEKVYDNVYTDRIKKVIPVGEAWAQKSVDMGYDTNANGEVRKYMVTTENWIEGRTDSKITLSGTYAANQLMKTSVTDEDGNIITEFQNGEGQTVLVRKNDGERDVDTYYLHNEFGQLAYVIPPLAVADTAPDLTVLSNLCYQYRYDGMGRTVEKKLPGKGWEFIVYDKQDRVVAVQDAVMRTKGQWLYTKYDRFGRVAFSGISTGGERSTEQGNAEAYGSNNVTRTSSVFFNREGIDVYYDPNGTYPGVGWVKLLSVNYYDTYPSYSFNPAFPGTILGEPIITDAQNASVNTLAMPTLSLVKNIEDDDNWTKRYLYYDGKGRTVGTYSINHLGGYAKTESELDFAGVTKQTKVYHKRLTTDTERVISQTFEFDGQNRLKKQWHQVDGNAVELMVENTYNELSQLSNKKVGNNLQSINYTYNIRGSLVKLNDPANLGTQLFGYELKYQNPTNTSLAAGTYNGNIAEVTWKTGTDQVLKRYNYQYDPLNRLKKGTYSEPTSSVPVNNLFNESAVYDVNGNITSLQRNGKNSLGVTGLMDNLTYGYSGNKLTSVTDESGNYGGYPDSSGNIITYDENGNMKDHVDKGVLDIDYNILNLPDFVKFDQMYSARPPLEIDFNVNTQYLYSADGTKLRKLYTYGSGKTNTQTSTITEYLDGFQYEGEDSELQSTLLLKFVPTAEGYYNFENNKYIYSYRDHLGNVRVSYTKNGAGTEIIEVSNYYPFGLKHDDYNNLGGNSAYNYGYNGKELQKETGWNDYGARMYMSDIGRWGVIDPLAEQYRRFTPYNYAADNPIRYIDPDGRKIKAPGREEISTLPPSFRGMINYIGPGKSSEILKFFGPEDNMGSFYATYNGGGGNNGTNRIYSSHGGQVISFTGDYARMIFTYLLEQIDRTGGIDLKAFHFVQETITPNIYNHTLNAFANGKPSILHYDADKTRRAERRKEATGKLPTKPGMHKDEYPFASTFEGGKDAMVAYVPATENLSQGGTLSALYQAAGLETGDAFMVIPVPKESTPEEMKQEVLERLNPQPVPVPQQPSFRTPAVPYKAWPVVMGVALIYAGYLIYRSMPAIP